MPTLDDHATRELRTLLAALTPTARAVDRDAAPAPLESWAGGELGQREDAGGVDVAVEVAVRR